MNAARADAPAAARGAPKPDRRAGPLSNVFVLKPKTGFANTAFPTFASSPTAPIVPEGCGFRVGNETARSRPAWVFDDTIERGWNESDKLRVCHLRHLAPPPHAGGAAWSRR